jgi:hypothetical protein
VHVFFRRCFPWSRRCTPTQSEKKKPQTWWLLDCPGTPAFGRADARAAVHPEDCAQRGRRRNVVHMSAQTDLSPSLVEKAYCLLQLIDLELACACELVGSIRTEDMSMRLSPESFPLQLPGRIGQHFGR